MASSGRRVGLNLGQVAVAGGRWVGLNLGVDWWDEEPPLPASQDIRSMARFHWRWQDSRRKMASVGWGRTDSISKDAAPAWQLTSAVVSGHVVMGWGLSGVLRGAGGLGWSNSRYQARRSITQWWAQQGRQRRAVQLGWGHLPTVEKSVSAGWSVQDIASRSVQQPWGRFGSASRQWLHRWMPPKLWRSAARLPWGSALPLPWIVRPPVVVPEPEPEPAWPSGDRVGLNLGCPIMGGSGVVALNLGVAACYAVRPRRRTYVVINSASMVRLPDRAPIALQSLSISSSVDAWGSTFDFELADPAHAKLLQPTAAGPRQFEVALNGYTWTGVVESQTRQREFAGIGVRMSGRSTTALLAAPYAPVRVKASNEQRSISQLVAEELQDTGFSAAYETVDWLVPGGAWFYDSSTPLDAISALAAASGAVVQSAPASTELVVRARYPTSPWDWRSTRPDHMLTEDLVVTESMQMRSAPMYDAVIVTGELQGKGVTCKVRREGSAGQLFAPQASSPLISTSAAGAERGRNILADRGEQAAVDLSLPLFAAPLREGEVGRVLPLDLVQVAGEGEVWHGLCTQSRIEVRSSEQALVIEQIITLERHYSDAD